jgi:hypothetical protein
MELISIVLLCVVLWNQYQLYKKMDSIQDIVTDYPEIEKMINKYKAKGKKAEYDRESSLVVVYDS